MGCCSAIPASAPAEASASASSSSGQPIEVTSFFDGSAQKVLLASASYCYCLLISSASIFVDVRDKGSFSKSHLYGAWSLHFGKTCVEDNDTFEMNEDQMFLRE